MKKLSLSKLSVPHINPSKTFYFVVLALSLLLAIFVYGAVRKVQLDKVQAQAVASQQAAEKAQKDASKKAFAEVQSDLNIQTTKAVAACSVLRQYAAAPKTKNLVQVPPICAVP